jgi:hypothetical protein
VPKTYNGEKTTSSANVAGESGCLPSENWKCLSPFTSINSKGIKDLNIRSETVRLVQEREGNALELIDIGNDFLYRTQMAP